MRRTYYETTCESGNVESHPRAASGDLATQFEPYRGEHSFHGFSTEFYMVLTRLPGSQDLDSNQSAFVAPVAS